jgi:Trk K+ transport system NAD-binding subunit
MARQPPACRCATSTWISLVIREGAARQARGSTVLQPGDEVLVLGAGRSAQAMFEGGGADGSDG